MPDDQDLTTESEGGDESEGGEGEAADDDKGPKISLAEGIIMVMISLVAEGMDVLGSLTAILVPLSWASDLVNLAIIQGWLIIKGGIGFRKQAIALTGNLIELIPILDILPIRTVALLIAIYMINHPETAKKVMPVKTATK